VSTNHRLVDFGAPSTHCQNGTRNKKLRLTNSDKKSVAAHFAKQSSALLTAPFGFDSLIHRYFLSSIQ
jgi:hypothetical protein